MPQNAYLKTLRISPLRRAGIQQNIFGLYFSITWKRFKNKIDKILWIRKNCQKIGGIRVPKTKFCELGKIGKKIGKIFLDS